MQSIRVKYLSATDTKGSRLKAIATGGQSVTIGYPYELSGYKKSFKAVQALCKKLGWEDKTFSAGTLSNNEDIFTITGEEFTV